MLCKQKAAGSSPAISTTAGQPTALRRQGAFTRRYRAWRVAQRFTTP
jgi:hypothetical protein